MKTPKKRLKIEPKYLIIAGTAVLLILVLFVFILRSDPLPPVDFNYVSERDCYGGDVKLAEGIYIGTQYVGGLTKEQARKRLSEAYSMPENQEVRLYFEQQLILTTLDDLGASWSLGKAIDRAITLQSGGGLARRYKTAADLAAGTYHLDLSKTLDRGMVEDFLTNTVAAAYDVEPVNASIRYNGDGFTVTEGSVGRVTDIGTTAGAVMDAFHELGNGEQLVANVIVRNKFPEITSDDLSSVKDVLGSCTTVYRKEYNERTDRCINVEVATAYLNGSVLMPGQSLSTSDTIKEREPENGYAMGGQYVNGQLEDAIGGGVCQVSSTLYNALLKSEIQIDRRSNHSLSVSYLDPSMDAAIATGSKDLVFTNNLDSPIYIFGDTDGYRVTFRIYGREYRPAGRSLEFVSVEEKRVVTEDKKVDDPTLYVGETKKVGTTHDEIWSHLEKVVYMDGEELSREIVHSDYYMPSQATVHVGTMPKPTEAPTEAATEGETENTQP